MTTSLTLAQQLIQCPSITPNDAGCQTIIAEFLKKLDFDITYLPYGNVTNLWARHGTRSPLVVFVGHTDVVPPGPEEQWLFPPFSGTLYNNLLYGRGAADMKGNIAAMLTAYANFAQQFPQYFGSFGFLITSDEEGPAINGTIKVVEFLQKNNIHIDHCIVGEPSCEKKVGDTIKIGRRGSLSADMILYGKQGHIAYPHLAKNPIHFSLPFLKTVCDFDWDDGEKNPSFPPTSFQISNIHAGVGTTNIIPGELHIASNFRYSPIVTAEILQEKMADFLEKYGLEHTIQWHHSAHPFYTPQGKLITAAQHAIHRITSITPTLSTNGGTSDGRFIAPLGAEIIEFGLCNQTIHQINEHVAIQDLETVSIIYFEILKELFGI